VAYNICLAFEATTGLTLEAQLIDADGGDVGSVVATGFTEVDDGWYVWGGSIPDGHVGAVIFRIASGGAVQVVREINPAQISLDQSVPFEDVSSKTTQTVGDALSAMRAYAAGKMTIADTVQTYYGPDGSTVVRQFTTNDPVWPSQRS
jgi:hypothetical protein